VAKDINIHLKTSGADQTKQKLDEVGRSGKQVGDKVAEGQKQAAPAVEQTTQKLGPMGRLLQTLKTQAVGFIGAFLGLQVVLKLINWLIQRLERIQQLQKEIYKDEQVRRLGMQLAPFVGAAGLGPEEVSKLFEFAGAAGIQPTADAYKDYIAQLMAGYTASKAVDFGQYMIGLQKGGTAYLAQGGTLEEAISAFAAARAVTASENLAATLIEQTARLSAGGYEKPRLAMEQALGVKWSDLSMDRRMAALLDYVRGLPKERTAEILAEQGFPLELTTAMGKMVTPEATRTLESTRQAVADATAETIDHMSQAYLDSMLGQQRQLEAGIAAKEVEAGPAFSSWQRRIRQAKTSHAIAVAKGQDRWVIDHLEPYLIALDSMRDELDSITQQLPDEYADRAAKLRRALSTRITYFPLRYRPLFTAAETEARISPLEYELESLREISQGKASLPPAEPTPPGEFPQAELQAAPEAESLGIKPDLPAIEAEPPVEFPQPETPAFEPETPSEFPQPALQPVPERIETGKPVSINYDHRTYNLRIHNPVVGVNKADLGIEPPWLS